MEAESCLQGILSRFREALISKLSYIFVRNTIYKSIYDLKKPSKPTNDLSHREKGVIGAFAGAVGTVVAHPLETIMVRKTADIGRSSEFIRPSYNSNLFRGLGASIAKASLLNGFMIWPYDIMKEKMFITFGNTVANIPIALAVSTFLGTSVSIMFDNIKTRLQASYDNPKLNRLNYKNEFEVFAKALMHEGPKTFLSGYVPLYMKLYIYAFAVS